jgi:succinyl-CoA synthetase beta subunit
MNIHEFQAKHLFEKYGLPVPKGGVVSSPTEAVEIASQLGGNRWVVKAQVHAGGRGKAGGVKLVSSQDELKDAVSHMVGSRLVTIQTDEKGQPVHQVWIEVPSDIDKELYLSIVLDRASRKFVIVASSEGGVSIEEVAEKTPEKMVYLSIDVGIGLLPFQCREVGFRLGLNLDQIKQLTRLLMSLYKMTIDCDLGLVEINPLVINKAGDLVCLDAKVNIDDNALYRQAELREMRDSTQEDERENRAQQWDLNYIALDGDIGCMVNGAGLAMATMDLVKLYGGSPANFLDVGGSATKERVAEAFKIILSDENVKGVLVNIFGGIVRCDLIADGIIEAVSEVGVTVPVVVRLEGNNAELGIDKLKGSGLNVLGASSFSDAAKKIVAAVKEDQDSY